MKTSKIFIPVKPVPACRPRVSPHGTFYSKPYTDFRRECYHFLSKIKSKHPVTDSCYKIEIDFICRRPKKPSNEYPVGDVDNYLKGPLDAITTVGMLWMDDIQVISLSGTKRYAKANEEFGMHITIHELSASEASELL